MKGSWGYSRAGKSLCLLGSVEVPAGMDIDLRVLFVLLVTADILEDRQVVEYGAGSEICHGCRWKCRLEGLVIYLMSLIKPSNTRHEL